MLCVEDSLSILPQNSLEEKLLKQLGHIFPLESFDTPAGIREILAPLPNLQEYNKQRDDLAKRRRHVTADDDMCNIEPLLTAEQETHLFRRYNFHKYKAKQRLLAGSLQGAQAELKLAQKSHSHIVSSNIRMVVKLMGKFRNHSDREDLKNEALVLLCKVAEYFDWRRQIRFSTYYHTSFMKTMSRLAGRYAKTTARYMPDDNGCLVSVIDRPNAIEREGQAVRLQPIMADALSSLDPREREIVMQRFFYDRTLKDVGNQLGISKERVRQLETKGITQLRSVFEENGQNMEDFFQF